MFSWLKKHFIPHEGNDHRPHILRGSGIRNIVILIIFLEIFAFLIPTLTRINMTGNMAAVLPAVLADLTNNERQEQNLSNSYGKSNLKPSGGNESHGYGHQGLLCSHQPGRENSLVLA